MDRRPARLRGHQTDRVDATLTPAAPAAAPSPPGTTGVEPGLRLAPHAVVLRRSPHELQVGVEPSVVVPRSYEPVVAALADGATAGHLGLTAREAGLPADAVADLLGALDDARLLRPPSSVASRAVRVVGAGTLGSRTAHALATAGFGTVHLADLPSRVPTGERALDRPPRRASRRRRPEADGRPERLELLAASLGAAHPSLRVRRPRHFAQPEGGAVALTVVVADGPEPDRLVPDVLREQGAPHLLVRCAGDEAVVGPLVVPGATSCVRCTDLGRRDADPRWPWLLEQLTRLHVEPAPTLLAWAAVTAAVQALAFVGSGHAETLDHTLELSGGEHSLRLRAWPAHPECPCRWDDGSDPGTHGRS